MASGVAPTQGATTNKGPDQKEVEKVNPAKGNWGQNQELASSIRRHRMDVRYVMLSIVRMGPAGAIAAESMFASSASRPNIIDTAAPNKRGRRQQAQRARARRPITDNERTMVSPGKSGTKVTVTPKLCMYCTCSLAWNAKRMSGTISSSWPSRTTCACWAYRWISFEMKDTTSIRRKLGPGFHNSSNRGWSIYFWSHHPATLIAGQGVNTDNMEDLDPSAIFSFHTGFRGSATPTRRRSS